MTSLLNFLFIEPFYGGSHRAFADGLIAASAHAVDLFTLPARFWKWRMRGAALYAIETIPALAEYDGLIVSDLMSLSDFKALAGPGCPPTLLYFHENQFTYPLSPGETMDYQFAFTDITSALTAERILFNSRTHSEQFFHHMAAFIQRMPDCRPTRVIDSIRAKSEVCHPGCDFDAIADGPSDLTFPPVIIWNHRWEHDKNPDAFFEAIGHVADRGIDFRLAILGERFKNRPPVFDQAIRHFGDRIIRFGPVESRSEYFDWLRRCTVVISTANQENFGMSVVEAARCGCLPLVPDRLSYPEIIPSEHHEEFLYRSPADLVEKLCRILSDPLAWECRRRRLSGTMDRFSWKNRIEAFDAHLAALAGRQQFSVKCVCD